MGSILLATDGSEYSQQAATAAIERAKEQDVPLHVICVVDDRRFDDPALGSAELARIYAEDEAALTVDDVVEMAAREDVPADGETKRGLPHEVILEYADEVDADAIVIGKHGDHDTHFSGVGRKLTEAAGRDVVVVEEQS
ncbi:universal stress protein [Salinibaculum salinum]|uniref:universal stress protein n=1 Tax=Salinibaculum salinum TaxID=3131996 RepID=UPI0030EF0DA5